MEINDVLFNRYHHMLSCKLSIKKSVEASRVFQARQSLSCHQILYPNHNAEVMSPPCSKPAAARSMHMLPPVPLHASPDSLHCEIKYNERMKEMEKRPIQNFGAYVNRNSREDKWCEGGRISISSSINRPLLTAGRFVMVVFSFIVRE